VELNKMHMPIVDSEDEYVVSDIELNDAIIAELDKIH
jgi:hypothetical protein